MLAIRVFCSDPSDNLKGRSPLFHVFNVYETQTFEQIFLMVLKDNYPVCYTDRGLDNSVITGLDICGEVSSIEVTDSSRHLQDFICHFKQISKIVFNLKKENIEKSDKNTVSAQNDKLFSMFCSPSVKLEREEEASKNKRQKLAGTYPPFTRQELRKAKSITNPTPNVDLAWDAIRNFLVESFEFSCAEDARLNPNHFMYDFIDDFSLLLLQVCFIKTNFYCSKLTKNNIMTNSFLLL